VCFLTHKLESQKGDKNSIQKEFFNSNVEILGNFSNRNNVIPVQRTSNLYDVLRKMVFSRVHRVAVTDENMNVVQILTQSSLAQFIFQNLEDLHSNPSATLEDLGLATKPVKTCRSKDQTLSQLARLQQERISALAVVDEGGVLLHDLSASSLRGLNSSNFNDLFLPIKDFLLARKAQKGISGTPKTTLRSCLELIIANKLHRLWICDILTGEVVGVVTLSDIVMELLLQGARH